jgi:hypothetical protein
VNLAKGILDPKQREIQSVCRLCHLNSAETQVHTTTTCTHPVLVMIRKLYKKDIDFELVRFRATKLKKSELWINWIKKVVIDYMVLHLWEDTQLTFDIWNGRWNRHMWNDILVGNAEDPIRKYNFKAFRL